MLCFTIYNGLNYVLQSGEEHRQLKISQLKFCNVPDPGVSEKIIEHVVYTEHGSKIVLEAAINLTWITKLLPSMHSQSWVSAVMCFCFSCICQSFLSVPFESTFFYWRVCSSIPAAAGEPWFRKNHVGHNVLSNFIKRILAAAGIDISAKCNHSLRESAISQMFHLNIAEADHGEIWPPYQRRTGSI